MIESPEYPPQDIYVRQEQEEDDAGTDREGISGPGAVQQSFEFCPSVHAFLLSSCLRYYPKVFSSLLTAGKQQ